MIDIILVESVKYCEDSPDTKNFNVKGCRLISVLYYFSNFSKKSIETLLKSPLFLEKIL